MHGNLMARLAESAPAKLLELVALHVNFLARLLRIRIKFDLVFIFLRNRFRHARTSDTAVNRCLQGSWLNPPFSVHAAVILLDTVAGHASHTFAIYVGRINNGGGAIVVHLSCNGSVTTTAEVPNGPATQV